MHRGHAVLNALLGGGVGFFLGMSIASPGATPTVDEPDGGTGPHGNPRGIRQGGTTPLAFQPGAPDAGLGVLHREPPDCPAGGAEAAFADDRRLTAWVASAHDRAFESCAMHRTPSDADPATVCAPASEQLWAISSDTVNGLIEAAAFVTQGGEPPRLLAATNCAEQDSRAFAASLHLASRAPAWTDPAFLRCAVERTSESEDFALWTALDASRHLPDQRAWLGDRDFHDPRTLRRMRQTGHQRAQEGQPP